MASRYEYKDALNVKGVIKGESDEIILAHSHHDAVYAGGVQDASGMSVVLALAKYFAVPGNKQSDKTYMFAAIDSHFTDYCGHEGFIAERARKKENIIYDFVIEHIGKDANIEDGTFVETGEGVPKIIYVSDEEPLVEATIEAVRKYGLEKTVILPVAHEDEGPEDYQDDSVTSDAHLFYKAGIKIVSLISSPAYLFHPSDTPERVMKDWLKPVGLIYAEIMEAASLFKTEDSESNDAQDAEESVHDNSSGLGGKYRTEGKSPLGKQECILTFVVDGCSLTGTAELLDDISEITDGKVEGNEFSFKINVKTPYGAFKFKVNGKVECDSISGKMSHPVAKIVFKGKRA
jgi:hypothetical protein